MAKKKDSGFCMGNVSGGKVGELLFCRKNMPVIVKQVQFKGEDCDVYEGSFYIAKNVQVKIYVKEDDFETTNGNTIKYRVTVSGFKTEPNDRVVTKR